MQYAEATRSLIDACAQAAHTLPGRNVEWLERLRRDARQALERAGFPSARDEQWRYTDVGPILSAGFRPAPSKVNGLDRAHFGAGGLDALGGFRIVFVDGRYVDALSVRSGLPEGVRIGGLAEVLEREPQVLAGRLGCCADAAVHGFSALNAAFLADGAYLDIGQNVEIEAPIHLLFVVTEQCGGRIVQPRSLIVAGSASRAVIIEHYVGLSDTRYFTNALTELILDADARVEHYRLQREGTGAYHIGGLHVRLKRASRLHACALDLGGRLVRNELCVRLEGETAECRLDGLYVVGGRQHVDNQTSIEHVAAGAVSREYYKGILDGRSRAVFNGRIVVRPGAQRTDAEQVNRNLLLSRDAEADTRPQLEIYADDVKCSHGATVGQIDADALFYLRSRAIDEATARDLLAYAFAADVVERIGPAPIRRLIERRLAAELLHGRDIEGLKWA